MSGEEYPIVIKATTSEERKAFYKILKVLENYTNFAPDAFDVYFKPQPPGGDVTVNTVREEASQLTFVAKSLRSR